MNAEVVVTELFDAGMITPTKCVLPNNINDYLDYDHFQFFRLHYVRSHGAVPQLNWETHRLTVFSDPPHLISEPKNWTMDELADGDRFRIVELPITFACDGSKHPARSYNVARC